MSKIACATSVVALFAAASLAIGRAEAQPPAPYLAPGAAPPWANSTTAATATTTQATPAPTGAATSASASTTPAASTDAVTPAAVPAGQPTELGTTTPVRVVSLHVGPNRDTPVIGTLHPGDQLEILARANYGWTEVRSSTATGWAYGSYLASGIGPEAGVSGDVVPTSAAAGENPDQATR